MGASLYPVDSIWIWNPDGCRRISRSESLEMAWWSSERRQGLCRCWCLWKATHSAFLAFYQYMVWIKERAVHSNEYPYRDAETSTIGTFTYHGGYWDEWLTRSEGCGILVDRDFFSIILWCAIKTLRFVPVQDVPNSKIVQTLWPSVCLPRPRSGGEDPKLQSPDTQIRLSFHAMRDQTFVSF